MNNFNSVWYEKYRPNNISDMLFDPITQRQIKLWDKLEPVLITGSPGSGKTTLSKILLENYKLYEFNSSNIISLSNFKQIIYDIVKIKTIYKKKCIIFDEIDGIEKKIIEEIILFINNYRSILPIICICNINNMKKKILDKLIKISYEINIKKPTEETLKTYINNISIKENINLSPDVVEEIIIMSYNDYRNILNILQFCKGSNNDEIIDRTFIIKLKKYLCIKNTELHVNDNIKKIINSKESNIYKIMNIYNKDKSKTPMIMYENYVKCLINTDTKCNLNIKLQTAKNIVKNIIKSDILEKLMYLTQNWCLQYIQGLTSCYIPLIYINNFKLNTIININWTEILSNATIVQNKRKKINSLYLLMYKYNNYLNEDIQFLAEIIIYYIINKKYICALNFINKYKLFDDKIMEKLIEIVRIKKISLDWNNIEIIKKNDKKEFESLNNELLYTMGSNFIKKNKIKNTKLSNLISNKNKKTCKKIIRKKKNPDTINDDLQISNSIENKDSIPKIDSIPEPENLINLKEVKIELVMNNTENKTILIKNQPKPKIILKNRSINIIDQTPPILDNKIQKLNKKLK